MRVHSFCIAAAICFCVPPSYAADLASRSAPPVFVPPAPVLSWTGAYIGVNVGAEFGERGYSVVTIPGFINFAGLSANGATRAAEFATASNASFSTGRTSLIAGGQIGYNRQIQSFVVGVEADLQGLGASASKGSSLNAIANNGFGGVVSLVNASKHQTFIGTVRGRAGYLVTPSLLVFATGGLAYGQVQATGSIVASEPSNNGTAAAPSIATISTTKAGYSAGGGAEYKFTDRLSLKAEYVYYNLGHLNAPLPPLTGILVADGSTSFAHPSSVSIGISGSIARVGLNYALTFPSPTVVARY